MGYGALSKGVRYFFLHEPGRSPVCVISSNGTHLDQFAVVSSLVYPRYCVRECSFEDMLNFPARCYSLYMIGGLHIEVNHSQGFQAQKVFKKFLRDHFVSIETR